MKCTILILIGIVCACMRAGAVRSASGVDGTKIPLCPGLTIVTAVAQRDGDYESIKTIESVDSKQIRLRYSTEKMEYPGWLDDKPPTLRRIALHRTVLAADLASAKSYQQRFMENSAVETIPGITAIGTSTAVLNALRNTGAAELGISNAGEGPWTWTADRTNTQLLPVHRSLETQTRRSGANEPSGARQRHACRAACGPCRRRQVRRQGGVLLPR